MTQLQGVKLMVTYFRVNPTSIFQTSGEEKGPSPTYPELQRTADGSSPPLRIYCPSGISTRRLINFRNWNTTHGVLRRPVCGAPVGVRACAPPSAPTYKTEPCPCPWPRSSAGTSGPTIIEEEWPVWRRVLARRSLSRSSWCSLR